MKSPYYRSSSSEEQELYDHLIACRKVESPEQLLERFRCLFIDGVEYPDSHILVTLYKVATFPQAAEDFKFVINRCCRILINYWWFQPAFRWAIAELVYLLEAPPRGTTNHLGAQRLRRLVSQFTQTEEYRSLQRLALVVEEGEDLDSSEFAQPHRAHHFYQKNGAQEEGRSRSLRHLIYRYPYLYPYCLGSTSADTEFEAVRHLQAKRQKQFECDLSRYVTYMVQQSSGLSRTALPPRVKNPTLLRDDQLRTSIRQFTGQVESGSTYRDLARRFQAYTAQAQTYRGFKDGLYHYLVSSIDSVRPDYGRHHFNSWLQTQLKNTLPQSDTQSLNGFLVTRTCQQLLDSLIANPKNVSSHFVFVDLINNVGATVVVGLLLKVLLLHHNLKANLEKRFAVLYQHYELVSDGVEWLIESLENLQIAFSIHFGGSKFPCISQI